MNFKYILFFIGLLILGALYLCAVEICRPACLLLWFIIPAYILAAVAILEG